MVSEENNLHYQFLPDKPLGEGDSLDFGHDGIASAVVKIVFCCKGTLNIGLFGGWGSGKSTIADRAACLLQKKGIPVVIFDVWKHECDNLRSSFLKECYRQLNDKGNRALKAGYKLPERLDQDLAKPEDDNVLIKLDFLRAMSYVSMAVFAGVLLLLITLNLLGKQDVIASWDWSIVITALVALFGAIFGPVMNRLQKLPKYRFLQRFQDPHEFQDEFERLLKNVNNKRILFIIDNLDRVTHEASIQMLSMIKTFLEPTIKTKNVAFLIPCDDRAIREHVRRVYLNDDDLGKDDERAVDVSSFQPDEFLRKFFNSIVWIPEFRASELESFTGNCLRLTRVKEFDDDVLAWLITVAFRENPRQIKQFINTLLSNFILATEREASGDLPTDFSKRNLKQLCLYFLLCTRFPKCVEGLKKNKVFELRIENDNKSAKREAMWKFVEQAYIAVPVINNLRTFYSLRYSVSEKKIPGITELLMNLIAGDFASANEQADGMTELGEKPSEFNEVLRDELDRTTNPVSASNLISGALKLSVRLEIPLNETSKGQIRYTVWKIVGGRTELLSPVTFLTAGLLDNTLFANLLIDNWFIRAREVLQDPDGKIPPDLTMLRELFQVISERQELGVSSRDIQKTLLSNNLLDDIETMNSILNADTLAASIFDSASATAYVGQLQNADWPEESEEYLQQFSILNKLCKFGDKGEFITSGIAAYASLITHLSKLDLEEDNESTWVSVFDLLNDFLLWQSAHLVEPELEPSIIVLDDAIVKTMLDRPEYVSASVEIPALIALSLYARDPRRNVIEERLIGWFSKCTASDLQFVLEKSEDSKEFIEKSIFAPSIENNAIGDPEVTKLVYPIADEMYRLKFLKRQIKEKPTAALTTVQKFKQILPRELDVSQLALEESGNQSGIAKIPFLKLAAHFSCDHGTEKLDKYASEILDLLTSTVESEQAAGLFCFTDSQFISDNLKYHVVKNSFDWLKSSEVDNKFQPSTLKAILHGVDQFNSHEKGDLSQFCWDELIRKSENALSIQTGFDLLARLRIRFGNKWRNNFTLVLERAERLDTTEELRKELKVGLLNLKPKTIPSKDKEFWNRVNALGTES